MSRYAILLEKFQEGGETAAEAEELAFLVREDPERATALYDALMLEADLYDSYAGIAQIRSARPSRRSWASPKLVLVWSAAVFLFVGVAILLTLGRPSPRQIVPAAPPSPSRPPDPPPSEPAPEKEPGEHRSKKAEIEREYQKGLKEVERKRAEGKAGEADKKLREIEREREKQLRELDRRR